MKNKTNQYVKSILNELQKLEEITGPDTTELYIETLETVKSEIETRIKNAESKAREL